MVADSSGDSKPIKVKFCRADVRLFLPHPGQVQIAIVFDRELQKMEQEYQMPYVTSIERRALQQGIEQGIVAGQIQLLQRLLSRPESAMAELLKQSMEILREELACLQQELASRDAH